MVPPFSGVILPFISYHEKCVTHQNFDQGMTSYCRDIRTLCRNCFIYIYIYFDTISEMGYLLMLERENFLKFLAHELRQFYFFFQIGHWDIKTFFFFFQRRNNTWRMLLSNRYIRLMLLTVLKRMSFFQRSVVSKILAKYFYGLKKHPTKSDIRYPIFIMFSSRLYCNDILVCNTYLLYWLSETQNC